LRPEDHFAGRRVDHDGDGRAPRDGGLARQGENRTQVAHGAANRRRVSQAGQTRYGDRQQRAGDNENGDGLDQGEPVADGARPSKSDVDAHVANQSSTPCPTIIILQHSEAVPLSAQPRMRHSNARLILIASTLLCTGSCANPKSEAATAQALSDAANEIGGLKDDLAQMQTDMDSLRTIVARHDSVLTRIEAGIPK
jgi:hypothetical protein